MSNTDFEDAQGNVVDFMMEGAKARRQNSVSGSMQEAFDEEADPAKAAEAIDLSEATGAPPATVHQNLDEFKKNYKAQLMGQLIKNNPDLQTYANSHPLAPKVSANDWPNLDEWSEKLKALPKGTAAVDKAWWESVGGIASHWFSNLGESVEESTAVPGLVQIGKDITKFESPSVEFKNAVEKLNSEGTNQDTIGGVLNAVNNLPFKGATYSPIFGSNVGAQEFIGAIFTDIGIITGVIPTIKTGAEIFDELGGIKKELSEPAAMLAMMLLGLRGGGKAHSRAGELPPPGLDKEVDAIREHRSREDLKAVNDATSAAQKSETTQIAPSLAEKFVQQRVKGQSVQVNVDAIRKLYGDKTPSPDDGLLGWVPGLAEQIDSQSLVGGDVHIPMELWQTRIDPEIAKVLKDDMKVTEDGISVNEAQQRKENQEALKPEETDLAGGPDLTRRSFLKGTAATIASAATKGVPEAKFDLAGAAAETAKSLRVEHNTEDILNWVEEWSGLSRHSKEGQAMAIQALEEGAGNHERQGKGLSIAQMHRDSIEEIKAGRIPETRFPRTIREEASTNYETAKTNWLANQKKLFPDEFRTQEMRDKLVEEGVPEEEAQDLAQLPWPEEYMKAGLPKGLSEPGPRNALRQHDEALASVRQGAQLTHLVATEPVKLDLISKAKDISVSGTGEVTHTFSVTRGDEKLGGVEVIPQKDGKLLYIDWAGSAKTHAPWQEGNNTLPILYQVGRELRKFFPDAERIGGIRGDRYVEYPLDDLGPASLITGKRPEGWEYVEGTGRQPPALKLGKSEHISAISVDKERRYETKSVGTISMTEAFKQLDYAKDVRGSLGDALRYIADAVTEKAGNVPIHIIKDAEFDHIMKEHAQVKRGNIAPENVGGFYDPNTHIIIFAERHLRDPYFKQNVLHESIHAATVRGILFDDKLKTNIESILDHVKSTVGGEKIYGLTNAKEFLAELANPKFQKLLLDTKIPDELAKQIGPVRGKFASAWDMVINSIAQFLGLKGDTQVTALEAALRVTQQTVDRRFSIEERRDMIRMQRMMEAMPTLEKLEETNLAVSSTKQIELIRSLARLEDQLAKQAGLKPYQLRGILSDLAAGFKPEEMSQEARDILSHLDKDDVKNYVDYIENITDQARDSFYDYQAVHKKEIEGQLELPDLEKIWKVIDNIRQGEEVPTIESPSVIPPEESSLAPQGYVKAFHGSDREFAKPDTSFGSQRGGSPDEKNVIFLSQKKDLASLYGRNVTEHNINLTNSREFDVSKLVKDPEFLNAMRASWERIATRNDYLKQRAQTEEGKAAIERGWQRILEKIKNPENDFGFPRYDSSITGAIIKQAREEGLDVAIIKNMAEGHGRPSDQFAVLNNKALVDKSIPPEESSLASTPRKGIWRSADTDFPVEISDEAPVEKDGKKYQKVIYAGKETYVPLDELIEEKPKAEVRKRPTQPELPQAGTTRMEDRKAFKTPAASGMTRDFYEKFQKLIAKQRTEDGKRRMELILRKAQETQTKEWKDNFDRIYKEVEDSVRQNPDFLADAALRRGHLEEPEENAPKTSRRRDRLDSDKLTEEQKAILDPSEHASGAMNPDDFAAALGFNSGDGMLERLSALRQFLKDNNLKPDQLVKNIALEETERRMQAEHGDLGNKILEEARDAAMSESQYDLLHEETLSLATSAGLEFSLTRQQVKEMVKQKFDTIPQGQVSEAGYLRLAGKHGEAVQKALLDGDYMQAFRSKQAQYFAMEMARLAKALKKANDSLSRNFKRFAKRSVSGIDQEYTNVIHDIMFRVDSTPKPRRTPEDLLDAFNRSTHRIGTTEPLRNFVKHRTEAFRELAVPDWLQDPSFKVADYKKLTTKQVMELNGRNNFVG